jgi:hypothetical protein
LDGGRHEARLEDHISIPKTVSVDMSVRLTNARQGMKC